MQLRKTSETATKITFEILDVPAGTEAFAFYADGKRVSKTCKSGQREVTFSKGAAAYTVTAVSFNPITSASWPTSPPPTYVKVAPRVVYKQDGSDARFCMFAAGSSGPLAPGVTRRPDGRYTDESGAVYDAGGDGFDESGIRSDGPALTGAREIDDRPICSLPRSGDPTLNTGSWLV